MSPFLNHRARLERASRNNVPVLSASDTFRRFKWFTLFLVILFPIYPSLSALGSTAQAQTGDYDDTTIITAYTVLGEDGKNDYISDSGLVNVDLDKTASGNPSSEDTASVAGEVPQTSPSLQEYTVKDGDTIDTIASSFGISNDAILWANDMIESDSLRVGQVLKIPPVSGVVHHVERGDTISTIATKYNISEIDIVTFNNLSDSDSIRAGMDLMIPGAVRPKAVPTPAPSLTPAPTKTPVNKTPPATKTSTAASKSRYSVKYTGNGRGFAAGNCTWFVAQNKNVTWRGNAISWMANARAQGVKTGSSPVPGAIVQFSGHGYNSYYGHVGIVVDVTDDAIIVKDMNYRGLYEVTIRKISINDRAIDGYIYVD